jgi:ankyrin repeat protein
VIELVNKNKTIIDSRDVSKGHTALHIAVKRRDLDWISYLLGPHANPNIADKSGTTPLTLAAQNGFTEGVSVLIGAGARVDVANSAGETPLISAVHRRDLGLLRVLLRAGANPDRNDNSGRSARDYAALEGSNNLILREIERLAQSAGSETPARVYGPGLCSWPAPSPTSRSTSCGSSWRRGSPPRPSSTAGAMPRWSPPRGRPRSIRRWRASPFPAGRWT